MKTIIFLLSVVLAPITVSSQSHTTAKSEATNPVQTVTPVSEDTESQKEKELQANVSFQDDTIKKEEANTVKVQPKTKGVVLIQTTESGNSEDACTSKNYPFTVYCLKNDNWILPQDILIALRAKIPSINVSNDTNPFATPRFRIRGEADPIILIDGIRVDASILNNLNPNDIESIMVAPSAAGVNHFLNGYRAY
ncbi:TonB-dependent receptor plug domain-containing protein [Flagellimonas sp.]|uniref:TonB-dependent receptor plug domain-containing protein n=1 Tax=Flagellimonas sp. TaxID=2058762 RepID=UPI003F4A53FF